MKTFKTLKIASVLVVLLLSSTSILCDSGPNNVKKIASATRTLSDGSSLRIYAFYVDKFEDNRVIWGDLEKLCREQEHTMGSNTVVLFFKTEETIPDISRENFRLSEEEKRDCIANFWKYPDGTQVFSPYPYEE